MDVEEAMFKRRSVRQFTEEKVEEQQIDKLLHFAMSGPSGLNRQPWEFYVVSDENINNQIIDAGRFSKHHSPLKIIVAGNTQRALPLKMKQIWIQDCSAAIENILLGVTSMGLGACWEGVYPQERFVERIRSILNLPSHIIPLAVLSIGHPKNEVVPRDQYNKKYVHFVGEENETD
ncbi:MAG TPA: nitroreductase family protein [Bacilli bacterium]|nr:nitroreductase family protein [Bacilli bacterium]